MQAECFQTLLYDMPQLADTQPSVSLLKLRYYYNDEKSDGLRSNTYYCCNATFPSIGSSMLARYIM